MAWRMEFKWKGDKQLMRKLRVLPPAVQRRVQRPAVTKATRLVAKAVKNNTPRETGALKKSIGSKVKTYPQKNVVIGIVGPRTDAKGKPAKYRIGVVAGKRGGVRRARKGESPDAYRNPVNYAHLVEGGRKASEAGKARGSKGRVKSTKVKVLINAVTGKVYGKRVRPVTGTRFMSRAVNSSKSRVLGTMMSELRAGLEREARRA
jgi:HK97 gp10 family phage protein